MSKITAVLLDLDGTLVDSIPDLAAAANALRCEWGLPHLPVEQIASFVGKGMENLVRRTLAGHRDGQCDETQLPAALEIFRRHYHQLNGSCTTVYPGVREGLHALRAQGLTLAVVTNKPLEFTLPLLEQTGLRAAFDVVVGGDSTAHKKPHPAPLLHACCKLGVTPAQALVIGDSSNDAQAARAAGCRVWIVPYGYNEGEASHTIDSDGIVATLLDAAHRISVHPVSATPQRTRQ